MIPCMHSSEHTLRWKKIFADSYSGPKSLATVIPDLDISPSDLAAINELFTIQITSNLLKQYADENPNQHPVLRQYLPNAQELVEIAECSNDPVGDVSATAIPGVIKKYANRLLIVTTNICPIHCRYCFRKDFPYPQENPNSHRFKNALQYCANDTTIDEVILSGGDPLSLEDDMLEHLISTIGKISHIKTIRLHTKFPSIIPERVTPNLLASLAKSKLNKVCVFHINHPDEITNGFCEVVQKIKNTNTITLNQSVLLKGVNDSSEILIKLSRQLFTAGILPYYLHMLDSARGTSHFHVSPQQAGKIMQQLKNQLPGYLVPKLAKEIAGHSSKIY